MHFVLQLCCTLQDCQKLYLKHFRQSCIWEEAVFFCRFDIGCSIYSTVADSLVYQGYNSSSSRVGKALMMVSKNQLLHAF